MGITTEPFIIGTKFRLMEGYYNGEVWWSEEIYCIERYRSINGMWLYQSEYPYLTNNREMKLEE